MELGRVLPAVDAEGDSFAVVEEFEAWPGKTVIGLEGFLRQGLKVTLFVGGTEQGGGVDGRTSGAWVAYSGG